MNNNFTAYELMVMVDALEKYASECEKRWNESITNVEWSPQIEHTKRH